MIKEAFTSLTKEDILQPFISDIDFRSTNSIDAGEDDNSVGFKFYLFDIRCEIHFRSHI